jgi:hypothetical protein
VKKYCLSLLLMVALCTGCSSLTSPAATSTSLPTSTPVPSSTPVAVETQKPVFDENAIKMLVLVKGFSIEVPYPLLNDHKGQIVSIADEAGTLFFSFTGDDQYDDKSSMEVVIAQYLESLRKRGVDLETGAPENIEVDGVAGTAVDVSGTIGGQEVKGRALAVTPHAGFVLFGLGIAKLDSDQQKWTSEGKSAFENLIASVKFIDSNAACIVSTDETYGYKPENPIKVGGADFSGPSRERAYLDNLRAPNGEAVTYTREGSTNEGDTILDIYIVSGPDIEATLYVDEYNFADLFAPLGFTCDGPFPLEEP